MKVLPLAEEKETVIPFFDNTPPVGVSTVGSKTTVPAEATPQIRVNKDNHTNRNALFIIVWVCGTGPTTTHLGQENIEATGFVPG